MLALGRLMTRALEVVEMLKLFPVVPVETLLITPADNPIVVDVPMIESLPSPLVKVRPEPRERLPRVVVPIPPELTGRALVRVREVKEGVEETAMVLVPVMTMLEPAVKREEASEKEGALVPLLLRTWKEVPWRLERKVEPS
jgi:hypothetical protein